MALSLPCYRGEARPRSYLKSYEYKRARGFTWPWTNWHPTWKDAAQLEPWKYSQLKLGNLNRAMFLREGFWLPNSDALPPASLARCQDLPQLNLVGSTPGFCLLGHTNQTKAPLVHQNSFISHNKPIRGAFAFHEAKQLRSTRATIGLPNTAAEIKGVETDRQRHVLLMCSCPEAD